ncbi:MAG: ABC transporter ATP-binding protein [Chloroflexi bacterium]|nr:ABC transporter ATP-binding protein [Chloroflexota bacterium]
MNDSLSPYIHCQDLFKIYKRAELEVVVLRGLDLTVPRGEFLGIIGASGSGKTTLLNILAGLDTPSAGQVRVGKRDLLDMTEKERVEYRRREVGFVWQSPSRNLLGYLTARENVEMPMAILGTPGTQRRERARELLAILGLEDKGKRLPSQLSGGEQQRVAMATALANQPSLLLADEPTGELDTRTADEVFGWLQRLGKTLEVTVVVVTHYGGIARYADRVVHMRDGLIESESVVVSTFQRPGEAIREDYLVVDKSGRLQLPQDSVDRLGLEGRAHVEEHQGGIFIKSPRRRE